VLAIGNQQSPIENDLSLVTLDVARAAQHGQPGILRKTRVSGSEPALVENRATIGPDKANVLARGAQADAKRF
jgi:hypothetical protein